MKHEKLKEYRKKEKKFDNLTLWIATPTGIVTMILMIIANNIGGFGSWLAWILVILLFVAAVISFIFSLKASKYGRAIEDYIIGEVSNIITENGIGKFEIIKESEYSRYKVGFHNQRVDYDDLQTKIKSGLATMNEIAKRNILVKLV